MQQRGRRRRGFVSARRAQSFVDSAFFYISYFIARAAERPPDFQVLRDDETLHHTLLPLLRGVVVTWLGLHTV